MFLFFNAIQSDVVWLLTNLVGGVKFIEFVSKFLLRENE